MSIWDSAIVQVDWKDGVVICIQKKGNLAKCDNWRSVTPMSVRGKVYFQMILNRMRDMVDGELETLYVENLNHIRNPRKDCISNQEYNEHSRCCVKTEDGYSDWFHVVTGVRQGCILFPLFFAVAIDWVMRLRQRTDYLG